jgi:vitamin B12 transporter
LKYSLLYIILLFSLPLHGQSPALSDTINIGEVIISRNKENNSQAGYKIGSVEGSAMKFSSQFNLAEILSLHSNIFIKSYGMGGMASPSFRGTGAGHTQLTWNGININSPMLGQSDLSLIPAGLIDDVQIYYGGASMPLGSGGIGGTINLATVPVWKKETQLTLIAGAGSFSTYSGTVHLRSGSMHFQSVTKAFFQTAENNFRYLNTAISNEPVWQRRTNSQVNQKGLMQELYFRKDRSVISARVWYEDAGRNLPSSMLNQQPYLNETQSDKSLRTMVGYDRSSSLNKFFMTGAWMMSQLDYTNTLASIYSKNNSGTFVLKSGMVHKAGAYTDLRIVVDETYNRVKSNNYAGNKERNTVSLTASADRSEGLRLGTSLLLREILDAGKLLMPDFTAGAQFRLIKGKDYFLKANISRNSRIPSMNDMYWSPGGNPDLKNEYAFMYELGADLSHKISEPFSLKYNASFFRNDIRDMIQWRPGEFTYWTAANIKSVTTQGLEVSSKLTHSVPGFSSSLNAGYTYTRAETVASDVPGDASAGKQLIYVPEHQANGSLDACYRKFYTSWITSYTGRRYLSVDNQDFLPGHVLTDLVTGFRLDLKNSTIDLNFRISNLFNASYQTIAWYPMPGRSYSVRLLFQIHK